MTPPRPPKPAARDGAVSLWRYARLFRSDILSAQPARLYRAWMAEFRTPFFRSYLINQPALLRVVLKDRPMDFPKSRRVCEGLRPLLGSSVFVTNGETWRRQRRIIDPAFDGGRLQQTWPAMVAAADRAAETLAARDGTPVEIEAVTSRAAADVMFRALFSIPIEDRVAHSVFAAFRTYQRSQPVLNLAALLPLPGWMPRPFRRRTRTAAATLRGLITGLVAQRGQEIAAGRAPDDLATKIMTTRDPGTGEGFDAEEMVDQVALFFLAGHETSASALAWALYLMALHPQWQDRVAAEAQALRGGGFAELGSLRLSRDVFRETLRLYPPVPMMVRETTRAERFRDRKVPRGAQIVLSPWHLHRHARLWEDPDGFDPGRWQRPADRRIAREAYMPFSAGARVCTGAGFAMAEGTLLLSRILRDLRVEPVAGREPVPEAHLTLRSREGIWLRVTRR